MDKDKRSEFNPRSYWRIFLPLALILLFCLRFPIRITLPDLIDDTLLYGFISIASYITARKIHQRSSWQHRWLLGVIILCVVLAGWQVVDIFLLRSPISDTWDFGFENEPEYLGWSYYSPTFKNPDILCHYELEYFIGNRLIAIAYELRHTSWWACGG